MLYVGKGGGLGFPNCIIPHLKMAEAFGGLFVGPIYTGHVVIVDRDGMGHEGVFEAKIGENVGHVEEGCNAFVGGIYLCFRCAADRNRLAL